MCHPTRVWMDPQRVQGNKITFRHGTISFHQDHNAVCLKVLCFYIIVIMKIFFGLQSLIVLLFSLCYDTNTAILRRIHRRMIAERSV